MLEIKEKKECCGCHACFNICPKKAISMVEDENGFKIPKINKELCIDCGLCEKVCPILKNNKIENTPKAYAVQNLDEKIRKNSSSGGIFSLIASAILDLNGVVFGAKFNEKFEVEHDFIEKKEDIYKFRGSKYVQSAIGECYKKVKNFLDEGRYVLFTGTPCQIEGLKTYLQKDYDTLYTQDIICHGVPAPKVWREYLKYRKIKDGKAPNNINFRQKNKGWSSYEIQLNYDKSNYTKNHKEDLFMQSFLRDACLRESCYECKFKKKNRISDITLADFWGMKNIVPELNDDKGTSLVIINSKKGAKLFNDIKEKTIYKEVDFEESIKYNKSMTEAAKVPKHRREFLEFVNNKNFNKAVKKYTKKPTMIQRIKMKVKILIRQ